MAPVRLAGLDEILACELQRRLDGLRPAGDEIDMLNPVRRVFHQKRGQRLGRLGGEKPGMGKGQPVELRLDRAGYRRMAVAEAGDSRATGPVEIAFAALVDNIAALTGNSDGIACLHASRKDIRHHITLHFAWADGC